MRNLAMGLLHNFLEDIREAAFYLRDHVPDPASLVDTGRLGAVVMLSDFRKELGHYPSFRLEKPDMQAVGSVVLGCLGPYDPQYKCGVLDTSKGNESLTLQAGVVVASLIGNQKMLQAVRLHSGPVADYLEKVYDLYTVDPGDSKIEQISKEFVNEHPVDAEITFGLLERLTANFNAEIERIPEDKDYLSRHIFKTGLVEYPGIGWEIEQLVLLKNGEKG